ncbi:hypothetical protein FisN_10Lh376 [Fistulifera solaris]|uniref:Uncharacterized protein n=1 Tax=Fistulifera solaris TaxID=1519565 RepID=A0A1Z5JUG9_FISSO|nr:hypothetical protein FisN_10Lh376 [Fistulifera solaris]|eukprot:GAX17683.1 hypothetical protein FisN_10Lh376 [Fistulifera solaris]
MEPEEDEKFVLEHIPEERQSAAQKAFRPRSFGSRLEMYRFVKDPSDLIGFEWVNKMHVAIWRDNGTLICLGGAGFEAYWDRKVDYIFEKAGVYHFEGSIYGKTDAAIAETATWFWSLQRPGEDSILKTFVFDAREDQIFDFAALQPEQLARILDSNPARRYSFTRGSWNTAQSIILASRPYPLKWKFTENSFAFEDDGTAFVDTLVNRHSSFGSVHFDSDTDSMPLSRENFTRLLKFGTFDKLKLEYLDEEMILLPFAAKVHELNYTINARDFQPEHLKSLNINTRKITMEISLTDMSDWKRIPVSFLNRFSEIGTFEKLDFIVECWDLREPIDENKANSVAEAMISVIKANRCLKHLGLNHSYFTFDWLPHLQSIFEAAGDHKCLHELIVPAYPEQEDPDFSWLKRLLSRNRSITVLDRRGDKITDGFSIDRLYALNRCYHGSAALMKEESTSLRPQLVATALQKNASEKFDHAALLLANHLDVLSEFMHGADLEDVPCAGELQSEH